MDCPAWHTLEVDTQLEAGLSKRWGQFQQYQGRDEMSSVVHLAWRAYPAAALIAVGIILAAAGVRRCSAAWRRPGSALTQPLAWMLGFRRTVLGLALAGLGVAWMWQVAWLLAVTLIIAAGETLESSLDIAAFRQEIEGDAGYAETWFGAGTTPSGRKRPR
jgi:hypothetical protein